MSKFEKANKLVTTNFKNMNFESFLLSLFVIIFITLILIISQNNYYGSDRDTFAVISSFIAMIEEGYYTPSRSFGNIFAELIFGSLVYFAGSKITSLIVALLFFFSILNFYFCFYDFKNNTNNFKIFFLLCVSNPILLFDNLNIIDFVLALFFFSSGCLLFKRKSNIFGVILFSFAIGCRLNFSAFAMIFLILYFKNDHQKLLKYFILITVLSILFYLSIFISNKLSLSFLLNTLGLRYENSGGSSFIFIDQIVRFIYKLIKSFGFFATFVISFLLISNLSTYEKITKFYNDFKVEIILILFNLLLFFFIPTKTSIISLAIILSYSIINKLLKKKYLFLIIILNSLSFFIVIDFLQIEYRYKDPCKAHQAVSAKFSINLQKGYLEKYLNDSKNNLNCSYLEFPEKYSRAYLLQKKLYKND